MRRLQVCVLSTALASFTAGFPIALAQSSGALVQPPTFRQPERGSLAGSLAKFSIGAEDVSRGSFSLPLPVAVPSERAALLAGVLPSYAPENGVSEWGIGWSAALSIQRFRLVGDVDYLTDDFTSPWGRLQLGSDAFFYPVGLKSAVRLEQTAEGWIATDPAGTRYEFTYRVSSPSGIYSWYLTRATTVLGDTTTVEYVSSSDGRPFVRTVLYGGPEEPTTYRLDLDYESLPVPLVDYRSGHALSLDRRVVRMTALARVGGRGGHEERWRYDLTYHDDLFGPGFRLESLTRTFASGESEPPLTYSYDLPEQATPTGTVFPTGEVEDAPNIEAILGATFDLDAILPNHAATVDRDDDGLTDLEHGYKFTVFHQEADGTFSPEVLAPFPPGGDRHCRPKDAFLTRTRTLVRMGGPETDLQVLLLEPQSSTTNIRVCDRTGLPRFDVSVPGRWTLGENIKLADMNRDDKPDLLQVNTGNVIVLENVSGQDGTIGFQPHPPIPLTYVFGFPFTPSATWAQDMNGDGNPDLVQRTDDRMSVWYGSGRLGFDVMEHRMRVLNRSGNEIVTLDDWEVTWVDANKDGLTDAVMSIGQESSLFINEGDHFEEAVAPTLDDANTFHMGVPVLGDLRARGDLDLYFAHGGGIEAATLTTASTGLLVEADDGKGTVVTFEYERSTPVPGLRQRPSVLRTMMSSTGGYDDLTVGYSYGTPRVHSVGHFLIGFSSVEISGPVTTSSVDFYNDDQITAQVELSKVMDARTPGLTKVAQTTYEEALYQGVRLRRSRMTTSGWCSEADIAVCLAGTTAALESSETLSYDRGVCATRARTVSRHGTLERTVTLASPAALSEAVHCAQAGEIVTGTHGDATLNFRLETQTDRNDLGQPTQVRQVAGAEILVLQDVTYHAETHRLATMSTPGGGVQTFAFDQDTGELQQVTAADQVVGSAAERHDTTDAMLTMKSDRGTGGVLASSFRYDGMERLDRRWIDFGGSNETNPLESVAYQFPSADFPGLVEVSSLLDVQAGQRALQAIWMYPDGADLATATRVPDGWVIGAVSTSTRTDLTSRTRRRPPLAPSDEVSLQTYAMLLEGTTVLDEATAAGFGHPVATRDTVQQGVHRETATTLALANRLVVATTTENATFETKQATDATGLVIWVRDENNATTQLKYDALGRLVGVTLADGVQQTLRFDGFGRPSRIHRDRVGDIQYGYEPVTGRLLTKSFVDADGKVERSVTFHHDQIGRVLDREHTAGVDGAAAHFKFRYDGDAGDHSIPGQLGYTTQTQGPAYTTTVVRNPDGTEASATTDLAGWMKIATTTSYYAGGQRKEAHRVITRLADGVVVDDITTKDVYDDWGRLQKTFLNGQLLAELHYDENSQPFRIDLPDGQSIEHFYDPATLRQSGFSQHIVDGDGSRQAGQDWTYNNRGLISSEAFDLGDQSWLRDYRYDPRGFLTRSQDADQLSTYSYTNTGLPKQVTDEQGTRSVNRGTSRQLTVGGVPYAWDASGRVIQRGDVTFDYGPDGNLAVAHHPVTTYVYHYDAEGNRILKYRDGLPVAGYLDGGYLTETGFVQPIDVGGRVVGVLDHGQLRILATDSRGTLLADSDGTPKLPTPYGARPARPDLSEALDYVEKAYDPALSSVRMGVRDYDPWLGQFWTPDPLFLERLQKCAKTPSECTLFGYARNNPISFVDPTGTCVGFSCFWAAREAGYTGGIGDPIVSAESHRRNALIAETKAKSDRSLSSSSDAQRFWRAGVDSIVEKANEAEIAITIWLGGLQGSLGNGSGPRRQIGAGSGSEKKSPFNPTNGRTNCVACVTSLIDAIENGGIVRLANEYAGAQKNFRFVSHALAFIKEHANVGFGKPISNRLGPPGDYVIFNGYNEGRFSHVLWGRVRRDGTTYFYDPQSATKPTRLEVGQFRAYPIIRND